ncbi:MAG: HD domain-containing protein [Thermoguttaceae bacterium]|nr:HD domain-containing protein [Planctomycetaceae bacterium]MBQ4144144.1 HD domain-containing protein [Thermoguttaceae bacterium]
MLDLTERYTAALAWICEIHAAQRRKMNQDPYVSHLLRVGGMVMEWAENEETALAALLHDAAEDCGGEAMLQKIAERFGDRTASLVRACSDSLTEDPEVKLAWRPRKEAHIAHAVHADSDARLIMICDKIDNMNGILRQYRQIGSEIFQYFRGGREIGWYFRAMFDALTPGMPKPLVLEMNALVCEIERICALPE